jgi:hypothetical protein
MIFQMASAEMNWRIIELYVKVFSNDNVGLISNSLFETSNNIENNIVPANRNNQSIDLNSQNFNHVEQSPHPDRAIGNLDPDPFDSPVVHSPMIYDNTKVEDTQNRDVDPMEEERNDDDEDFIPFTCEGWKVEEDYWDSTDKDDDSDYDPNEHIEQRVIVKGSSEKHHPTRDFSDVSKINQINILSQVQLDNALSENRTFNSKEHL